jgi:hypothetical protein
MQAPETKDSQRFIHRSEIEGQFSGVKLKVSLVDGIMDSRAGVAQSHIIMTLGQATVEPQLDPQGKLPTFTTTQ